MVQPLRTSTPTEVLAGLVERVTFHNAENGFCVLRVKARGQRDLITVLGHAAMIAAGEFIQASGGWVNDRTHGVQFKASFLKAAPPTTIEGIEKYLGSGMIRGIGPIYAKKLVRAFGEAVFEVIQQEPDRLREVTGIGPKRAERIVAGWAGQKVIREIMLFLHSNGVGTSRTVRIYKTYGADAVPLISENPYRLARDIRGIGFRTADQIAAKLGIDKTALIRVRAGISYALAEAMDEGHCGLPVEELVPSPKSCSKYLPSSSRWQCVLSSRMVLLSPTILRATAACFLLHFTEPSAKSPRSSSRWPLGSPPGPPLTSIRRSRGSSRGRSWRSLTAKKQRSGLRSSPT
jgi:Holliday junction resolvasome RuvABC DNA-binding subunit